MRVLHLPALPILLALPAPALACGAFFCSRGVPMDQSAERIVFAMDEGTVETHVQISYQGEATRFAWIVPVPGVPDVGLSSGALFDAIDRWSRPRFTLRFEREGDCEDVADTGGGLGGGSNGATNGGGSNGGGGGGPTPVDVLAAGTTGPYDWTVVAAKDETSLRAWLADPDGDPSTLDAYDVPPGTSERLAAYLAEGSHFIAFRLAPDATTGDIAPVKLSWPGDHATVPLVLTGLAATPDLRLQVHVLGDHRAVPLNYLHVRIDEAAIDWLGGGSNYPDVVTRAADEAGGHAFATDAFRRVPDDLIDAPSEAEMRALGGIDDPFAFFDELARLRIPGDDLTLAIFRAWLPMPRDVRERGVDERSFYNCLRCYVDPSRPVAFRPVGFARDLDERVAAPMRAAAALLDGARYDTRLTSSVSPEEMTVDPRFGFNPSMDGEKVDPHHVATAVVDCGWGWRDRPPRRLELADGTVIPVPQTLRSSAGYLPWITSLGLPAARVIERTSEDGAPEPIADHADAIAAKLAELAVTEDTDAGGGDTDDGTTSGDDAEARDGCGGCAQGSLGSGTAGVAALAVAALAVAARRRRR
jgi:hypothetical protein